MITVVIQLISITTHNYKIFLCHENFLFENFYFIYLLQLIFSIFLIFGCAGSLLWTFSSCGEKGLLLIVVCGLLLVVASLAGNHRLQSLRLQQLQCVGSVVVASGLQSTGSVVAALMFSCSTACVSSWTRDQTGVPCITRQILNHWITRESPGEFLISTLLATFKYSIQHY